MTTGSVLRSPWKMNASTFGPSTYAAIAKPNNNTVRNARKPSKPRFIQTYFVQDGGDVTEKSPSKSCSGSLRDRRLARPRQFGYAALSTQESTMTTTYQHI